MKKQPKVATPKAAKPVAKQYVSESHSYDSNRPKRPVQSRYKGAAGTAY